MAMASGTAKRRAERARERIAEARRVERRRRVRRIVIVVVAGVLLAAAAVVVAVTAQGGSARHAPAAAPTPPLWPRPDDTADRTRAIGLAVSPMEGTARHFHTHLDILV